MENEKLAIVTDGMNVRTVIEMLETFLDVGLVDGETVVVLDTFDGYRHGIERVDFADSVIQLRAKMFE